MFSPPTPMPTKMRRMASTIQPSFGVNTEARVKTVKRRTHQEKAALRPMRSARRPQAMAPITVPSPDMARIQPASKPFRCQAGSLSRLLTAKPMRNMSKNSDTLPMIDEQDEVLLVLGEGPGIDLLEGSHAGGCGRCGYHGVISPKDPG